MQDRPGRSGPCWPAAAGQLGSRPQGGLSVDRAPGCPPPATDPAPDTKPRPQQTPPPFGRSLLLRVPSPASPCSSAGPSRGCPLRRLGTRAARVLPFTQGESAPGRDGGQWDPHSAPCSLGDLGTRYPSPPHVRNLRQVVSKAPSMEKKYYGSCCRRNSEAVREASLRLVLHLRSPDRSSDTSVSFEWVQR